MATTTVNKNKGMPLNRLWTGYTLMSGAFILAFANQSQAADWKFTPSFNLSETYTDNVRLYPIGKEESAFVTQLSPGLVIASKGPRLKFDLNYSLQGLYYSNAHNGLKTNNLLHTKANAELVQNLFFLETNGDIRQQVLNPFLSESSDNLNLSNNKAEIRTFSVSPYFKQNYGNTFSSEARYSRSSTTTTTVNGINGTGDQFQLELKSGTSFKQVHWSLKYNDQKMHTSQQDLKQKMATAEVDYRLSPQFALTSAIGHEDNSYVSVGKKPAGQFWRAGFTWNPSERTDFLFNTGHRFYGKTYTFTAHHRTRSSVWSAGYNEDITTTQNQYLAPLTNDTSAFLNQLWKSSIPDDTKRQNIVNNFIRDTNLPTSLSQATNGVTNRVFLQKSLQSSVAFNGARNTVLLSLFNIEREAQSPSAADVLLYGPNSPKLFEHTKQFGVNVLWNWQIGPRTNADFSTGYNKVNSVNTQIIDKNKTMRAGLSQQLQPKLKATLELKRNQKDSTLSSSDFNENALSLYLLLGF